MKVAADSRTRTTLVVTLTGALIALGVAAVVRHRHDHRDEYLAYAIPWEYFETSADGRTLTFHGTWGSSSCADPVGVDLQLDRNPVVASAIYRMQTMRDGNTMFCTADLSLRPAVVAHLDDPLASGTPVVDGYEPSERYGLTLRCGRAKQRVGDPVPAFPSGPDFSC